MKNKENVCVLAVKVWPKKPPSLFYYSKDSFNIKRTIQKSHHHCCASCFLLAISLSLSLYLTFISLSLPLSLPPMSSLLANPEFKIIHWRLREQYIVTKEIRERERERKRWWNINEINGDWGQRNVFPNTERKIYPTIFSPNNLNKWIKT